jgi:ATP-dependent protease Clp ATPase subunit
MSLAAFEPAEQPGTTVLDERHLHAGMSTRMVLSRDWLRSIIESILLDTMFDPPSLEGVEQVVISREVAEGTARPLYISALASA